MGIGDGRFSLVQGKNQGRFEKQRGEAKDNDFPWCREKGREKMFIIAEVPVADPLPKIVTARQVRAAQVKQLKFAR